MKPYCLLIAALFAAISVFSQEQKSYLLQGTIASATEQVMYATVGIVQANVGTITDAEGKFELEVSDSLLDQQLTVSHVGYEPIVLSLDSLIRLPSIRIELKAKRNELEEVMITRERLKSKEFGNVKKHDSFMWIQNGEVGSEIVVLIAPNKPILVNTASVNILNMDKKEFTLLLNLYAVDKESGLPGTQLLRKQQIIRSDKKEGWLEVDLTDQNLELSEPFFVGFQWVHVDDPTPMIGGASKGGRGSLIRTHTLGVWQELFTWDIKVEGAMCEDCRK